MREIKVGQKWKWYEDSEESFEVISFPAKGYADIRYADGSISTLTPLSYWDEDSTLVEDVPEEQVNNQLSPNEDMVNHPPHYSSDPSGVECIQITRHRNFNVGNAIKYLWRAGLKEDASLDNLEKEIQDLEKAVFYIQDEIKRKRGA